MADLARARAIVLRMADDARALAAALAEDLARSRGTVKPSDTRDVDTHPRLPSHDAIATRAYEIYCVRFLTDAPGDALSDWLQAERELITRLAVARIDPGVRRDPIDG
jgi:hypothetical protein